MAADHLPAPSARRFRGQLGRTVVANGAPALLVSPESPASTPRPSWAARAVSTSERSFARTMTRDSAAERARERADSESKIASCSACLRGVSRICAACGVLSVPVWSLAARRESTLASKTRARDRCSAVRHSELFTTALRGLLGWCLGRTDQDTPDELRSLVMMLLNALSGA